MRLLSRIFLALIIPFSLTVFTSCKNYDLNTEIRQADSLIWLADQASQTLVIENEYIRQRTDSMKIKLEYISSLDTNLMNVEFRFDVTRYRALFLNYKEFVVDYEALLYDNKVFENYCRELKKSLMDKNVSRETFHDMYLEKRHELQRHLGACKKLVKGVVSTENMYQKLNMKISDFYVKEKLK